MANVTPNQRTWTLRFKLDRSTFLLEVDPLQKMADVRAELLHAVQDTNPSGRIKGQPIPPNPGHIKFGRAVDRHNLSLGFTSIENELEEPAEMTGKWKGKSAAGSAATMAKGKAGASSLNDCPQGTGLKNGDVIAFKFVSDHDVTGSEEGDLWNVDVPTMEGTYGEEETADDEGLGMDQR